MKPIIKKISFYPFSFCESPKKGYYIVRRYNIIKHKWITLERRFSTLEMIEDYVHDLNADAGIITETFIVGYKD